MKPINCSNRWQRLLSSLPAVALATVLVLPADAAPLKEGDAFPDLKTFKLEGELPALAGKVVIIDFFASWCGPCKDSFPVMQELHEKFGGQGLVILAVNLDKKVEDMKEFLAKHPVTFSIVRDASGALAKEVKVPTMPSSFIIDRSGKVQFLHRGFKCDKSKEEYVRQITELLK